MKEPKRIPLDPTTPRVKNVKTIPMPSIRPIEEEETASKSFWKFIAEHKASRDKWIQQVDENNS